MAVKQTRWSDPASWPDGKVPRAGDAVTIGRDRNILLDVAPPALRSLTINGKLSFSNDLDLNLTTEWIYLPGGELDIGSEARPHTRKAVITLTDNVPNEDINTMGDRGIMMLGGTLSLHGDTANSWTKLAKTARAGATKIEVLNAAGWRKGDQIVLASTDFNPRQAEERTVTAISGNALTLDKPLSYMHFGEVTFGVDERGEVGMLTRNIKIQASEDSEKSYFGGHIMAMSGSKMYLSGIELNRMGQNMHLARYPIHWHIGGEGQGQYVRNSAIHDTFKPLRDRARHQRSPGAEQRHLQHRRPLLLHGRRDRAREPVRPQSRHHGQVPSDAALRTDQPRHSFRTGRGRSEIQKLPDTLGQHGGDLLDHQSGEQLHRQCGRGVR